MAIFVDQNTRLVVQGITGRDGSFHTTQMMAYGTQVVAGVTPGKAGQMFDGPDGKKVPIFNSMDEAVAKTDANTSVIYVPPAGAAGAVMEAADAGITFVVAITEVVTPGPVGVISRSGTLTYEAVYHLTNAKIGQTTCVGIGGDPLIGTTFVDCLEAFSRDPETKAIVMIGEIGGTDEQEAARYVKERIRVPVVGFIAGQTAPPGRRMGHAGAIISGGSGTAAEKMQAFEEAGIKVAKRPIEIAELIGKALKK
jgi:succinyl-CoA synthetase alpha subunit